jgi:hypothetical protein
MDLGGGVGDAWEILANVGGNRGQPGSCALKAAVCPGGARWDERYSLLVVLLMWHLGWPLLLEVIADVVMTSL